MTDSETYWKQRVVELRAEKKALQDKVDALEKKNEILNDKLIDLTGDWNDLAQKWNRLQNSLAIRYESAAKEKAKKSETE